ncbi:MAG: UrcA family protein [Hyphomonadaceae bacterium]|nr:UrcA family protein [Hyphomonadaceae bacterium]
MSALAAVTLVLAPAGASAEAWRVGDAYVVRSAAADLAHPEGRAALSADIDRAAQRLCRSVSPRRARVACVDEARAAAVAAAPSFARAAIAQARREQGGQLSARLER